MSGAASGAGNATMGNGNDRTILIESLLGEDATWAQPDSNVATGIMASIGRSSPPLVKTRRSSWMRPMIGAAAAVAAVAAIVLLWPDGGQATSPADVVAVVVGTDLAPLATGTVTFGPRDSGWWMRLEVEGLDPAPAGSYYEGWVGDGDNLVSIGTFHMREGPEPVVLWAGVSLDEYRELSVRLQMEGGGAQPSQDVVLTGRLDWEP